MRPAKNPNSIAVDILFTIVGISIVHGYLIERRFDNNNKKTLPDQITIPATICILDGSIICSTMGAKLIGNCMCECMDASETFMVVNGNWSCTKNEKVREETGKKQIKRY